MLVYFGSQSDLQNPEVIYDLPAFDFLYHSTLLIPDLRRLPLLTPTDASGYRHLPVLRPWNAARSVRLFRRY